VRGYSGKFGFLIGAHALLATAATNALDRQADIAKVQEWLGHASISTTRIYDYRRTRPETDVQNSVLKRPWLHNGCGPGSPQLAVSNCRRGT